MKKEKILYITDLDGTLLQVDETMSEFAIKELNKLIDLGLKFSYATARSLISSSRVTKGLTSNFPVIVYNGSFIVDPLSKEIIEGYQFQKTDIDYISQVLKKYDINPIVYSHIEKIEKLSYLSSKINGDNNLYLKAHLGDSRNNPVNDLSQLYKGDVFYFTCIDDYHKLKIANEVLKDKYTCFFHKEIYTHEYWLEIIPKNVNKARAILQLKDYLKCDKIISFGDGINDIPMFEISDESYVVENAVDELKEIATGIIASNTKDGVVQWLMENGKF